MAFSQIKEVFLFFLLNNEWVKKKFAMDQVASKTTGFKF
jgi:hypothetical protein